MTLDAYPDMLFRYRRDPPLGLRVWLERSPFDTDPTMEFRFVADGTPESVFWALHVDMWAGDLGARELFGPLLEAVSAIGVSCEKMAELVVVVESAGFVLDQQGNPQ